MLTKWNSTDEGYQTGRHGANPNPGKSPHNCCIWAFTFKSNTACLIRHISLQHYFVVISNSICRRLFLIPFVKMILSLCFTFGRRKHPALNFDSKVQRVFLFPYSLSTMSRVSKWLVSSVIISVYVFCHSTRLIINHSR